MPESLRDRVARVLAEADGQPVWEECSLQWRYYRQADALIAASLVAELKPDEGERQRLGWLPMGALDEIEAREAEWRQEKVTVHLWPTEWDAIRAELTGQEVPREAL